MLKCPCCSGNTYDQCCQPHINNQSAPTALSLMRSRYTAYTMANGDYLLETTHQSTSSNHSKEGLEKWGKENSWKALDILSVEHGRINDSMGIVEFKAHYEDAAGKAHIHHERSNFLKEEGQWYYVDGSIDPEKVDLTKKVSRNDPCICGSGKKYKKCCG